MLSTVIVTLKAFDEKGPLPWHRASPITPC